MSTRRHQSGIALLTAVVLVALATVVAAAIAFDTALTARRGGGGAALDQSLLIAAGAEALAAFAIGEQMRQSSTEIHPDQAWARSIGPVEVVPGATLSAQLEDLQGRFNLNDLVDGKGEANEAAAEVFARLLEAIGLERSWAPVMVDWLDTDLNVQPGGAEDGQYSGESPPYRPPNRAIVSPSELLALKGFGAERYAKIAPYVTALPRGTPINLCTASGALLDAITDEKQWAGSPDALARNRAGKCFPRTQGFENFFRDREEYQKVEKAIGLRETTEYFQLRTFAGIGTSEFALYSLLHFEGAAGGAPRVRVVMRSFTE
jgi:general secretion pathway protein K